MKTKTKENKKSFTVKQLMEFAKSISKKAETDKNYRKVIEVASEKWESSCHYDLR